MPKLKSHKGLLKRIRITARGKIKHKRSGATHLMSGTEGRKGQQLRQPKYVPGVMAKKMERALHRHVLGAERD